MAAGAGRHHALAAHAEAHHALSTPAGAHHAVPHHWCLSLMGTPILSWQRAAGAETQQECNNESGNCNPFHRSNSSSEPALPSWQDPLGAGKVFIAEQV